MAEVRLVKPEEARSKVAAKEALFVCAYESEEMCNKMRLEGAITLGELNAGLSGVDKEQEIIFYCN